MVVAHIQPYTEEKATDTLIELQNIELTYGSKSDARTVLQQLQLSIADGEFICVLGPSGCGKTSLLKMIAGYEQQSAGTITIDGKPHTGPGPNIGVVFQHANLFPWMTVAENIEFGLKMKKMPKEERQALIAHYMQIVNLSHAAKQLPHELSGGMKQRVAIARALAPDPQIILMDEPFGALDSINRQALQHEVRQIWKNTNKTIFFITHDVDEAILLGSRVIVLNGKPGKIVLNEKNPLTSQIVDNTDCRDLPGYNNFRHKLLNMLEQTN